MKENGTTAAKTRLFLPEPLRSPHTRSLMSHLALTGPLPLLHIRFQTDHLIQEQNPPVAFSQAVHHPRTITIDPTLVPMLSTLHLVQAVITSLPVLSDLPPQ